MACPFFVDAWRCRSAVERETASDPCKPALSIAARLMLHLSRLDLAAARAARASCQDAALFLITPTLERAVHRDASGTGVIQGRSPRRGRQRAYAGLPSTGHVVVDRGL